MALYLKDLVKMADNGVLTAKVNAIGSIQRNKNDKEFRKITFFFPSTSKEFVEGVFEFNFKEPRGSLVGLKTGDTVEIKLDGDWLAYRIVKSNAESSDSSQKNTEQVKNERASTQALNGEDAKWAKKDIAQTLGMLTKLFYEDQLVGDITISKSDRFLSALNLAKEHRVDFAKAIDDCYKTASESAA